MDITECLLRELVPVAVHHLDSYLWALQHCAVCRADLKLRQQTGDPRSTCLHPTWLQFMGSSVHPALASREAEHNYLETLAERLIPVLLKVKT